jgi:peptidoglycan/xylan/chitin deacetylase (PgdA/CDA1 family)
MRAVLTFHSIDESGSVLSYPSEMFERLLAALKRCGIPILDLDTLLQPSTLQGIALTFDDGMRTVFTRALPILRSYSAPAHLFLTTSVVGATNRWRSQPVGAPSFEMLQWSEIAALQEAGVRIEAHTARHPDLRRLSDANLREECESADEIIALRLGIRPRYFAYPYGLSDTRVRNFTRQRYCASFTTDLRELRRNEDKAALPRLDAYYLRNGVIFGNLRAFHARAYLALRRAFRLFRN